MRTRYVILVKGLNLNNLLNIFYSRKFNISNVYKQKDDNHAMYLTISKSDYICAMSDRLFDKFNVSVVHKLGIEKFLFRLISLLGALIGIICSVFFYFNYNKKIACIDIVIRGGGDAILEQSVQNVLQENDIFISKDLPQISMYDLSQKIVGSSEKIAAATVTKNGAKLTVTIYPISETIKTGDLVSSRNAVIKSILVGTGEPMVKVGDVVREGDKVVKSDQSGNAVACIMGTVYYMGSVIYDENTTVLERTGKTKVSDDYYLLGKKIFIGSVPDFRFYETAVQKIYPFYNFFLPLEIVKTTYIELEQKTKFVPFNDVAESIKDQAKRMAEQNINSACQIQNIDYTIKREGTIVKVDCFIETLENIVG